MHSVLIHYDVEEHFVSLQTFFSGAVSAQKSSSAINRLYFGGQLSLEIVVLPPEAGTLLQKIGIRLKQSALAVGITYGVFWATVQLIDSPFVKEVSVELIGQTPTELIINQIRSLREKYENGTISSEELEIESQEVLEDFVSRSVQGNLEVPRGTYRNYNIPEQLRFDLEDAQSDLYLGVLADSEVRAVGFSREPDFPIPRHGFAERAIKPRPPRAEKDVNEEWVVSTRRVLVTSPNFDRDDQSYRKWKGRDASGTNLLFEIVDEEFWLKLHEKALEFGEDTILHMQLVTHKIDGRIAGHRALRVLQVDGLEIAEPLREDALKAILGKFRLADSISGVPDLFDD